MTTGSALPIERPLDAVLFDMDGLLVDTEPQWFAAESATVEQLGGTWGKQQQIDLLGSNLPVAASYMIEFTGSRLDMPTVMQMLLENMTEQLVGAITFQPGVLNLLDALVAAGVPLALVTSSVRVHVDMVLSHLSSQPFRYQVTAEDVANLKPHPEPYLSALSLLGASAERSVVLEDSPAGVAAAEAAGCHVVAVPSVVPIKPAPRRAVVESLTEVDLRVLTDLVTRW
ncbi:MAG: HAD family phosphatase [Actinomycetia bacterium]|nr:HAD family phosphatase [Actinomycetes bacterium]